MQHMTRRVARQLHSSTGLRARGLASAASGAPRPFRVLGLQQVAIGGLDKGPLTDLWQACTQAQTRTQSLPPSRPPSLTHSPTHSHARLLTDLWQGLLGVERTGSYRSETENVDEDILRLGR